MSEGTIIDARARFADPTVVAEKAQRQHAESLQQTRVRLEEADQIAREVSSSRRVPDADRPRFTRNLGRMIEASAPHDAHSRISELFIKVFGDEGAASALKKRKRYIRLAGEALPSAKTPGEYQADGTIFVRLAREFANINNTGIYSSDDAQRQAVLILVDGTSFDSRTRSSLRRSEAGRQEFVERMDELLNRLDTKTTNMSNYFDMVCELELTAETKKIDCKSSIYVENYLGWEKLRLRDPDKSNASVVGPTGEDGDQLDESTNWLAPKVLIGFLYSQVTVDNSVSFALSKSESSPSHIDELVQILIERYGIENLSTYERLVSEFRKECEMVPDYDFDDIDTWRAHSEAITECDARFRIKLHIELDLPIVPKRFLELDEERIRTALISRYGLKPVGLIDPSSEILSEIHSDIIQSGYVDSKTPILWVGHSVIISLYRERSTGRARITFTISTDEMKLEYDRIISRFPNYADDNKYSSTHYEEGDISCFMENFLGKGFLCKDEYDLRMESQIGCANKLHFLPGTGAIDLCFLPVGRDLNTKHEIVFKPIFNDYHTAFSPAPQNTIAGAILRNLAYAPPGERIDEILLLDAQGKEQNLNDLIVSEEKRYRDGVRRLSDDV